MLGAFVAFECVAYRFRRHIRYDFEPLHEWLGPGTIGATPFWRLPCRRQDSPRRFSHGYNSTLISTTGSGGRDDSPRRAAAHADQVYGTAGPVQGA